MTLLSHIYAHRSLDPTSYYGVLGEHNSSLIEGTENEVQFSLILPHERFIQRTFSNDIALMKVCNERNEQNSAKREIFYCETNISFDAHHHLQMQMKEPVSFTAYIIPICLPKKGLVLDENDMVTVSGWGTTKGRFFCGFANVTADLEL